jgi:hypothetical protein
MPVLLHVGLFLGSESKIVVLRAALVATCGGSDNSMDTPVEGMLLTRVSGVEKLLSIESVGLLLR